jgi:hypothetical protein
MSLSIKLLKTVKDDPQNASRSSAVYRKVMTGTPQAETVSCFGQSMGRRESAVDDELGRLC